MLFSVSIIYHGAKTLFLLASGTLEEAWSKDITQEHLSAKDRPCQT